MSVKEEQILRSAKEIIVKYIEIGRISPASFPENFKKIYEAIDQTVKKEASAASPADPADTL